MWIRACSNGEVAEQRGINGTKTVFWAEGFNILQNIEDRMSMQQGNIRVRTRDPVQLRSVVKNNKISVTIPESDKINDAEVQNEIRKAIELAWRNEAKEYLPVRVKELAVKHNFVYKKVSVKNSKTRWGSCSFDNNINLSLHLMRLPNYLVDYVILHELVHTKIKNHSKDFWQLLDIVSGNAKKLDREVKDYRIQIY